MSLRPLLGGASPLLAPGVYDALGAVLAEEAGFSAGYVSGASIAYTRLARPDLGFFGLETLSDIVGSIRDRTDLPLIVDADTGFGNALNVQRAVRILERRGASAIQIEDQSMPKRCGHLAGKRLVSTAEMVGKIKAACDARQSADTLIVARTDAVAVEGLEASLERGVSFVEAGADILFVEALPDEQAMRVATQALASRVPMLVNMVEGGKTPIMPTTLLGDIGFRLIIYPGGLVRAVARTMRDYFSVLSKNGTTDAFRSHMLDFAGINDIIGTQATLAQGERYDPDMFMGAISGDKE